MINATSTLGRILPGLLADCFGTFNIQIFLVFSIALSILVFWMLSTNQAAIITFALVYGFIGGGFLSLCLVCCAMVSPIENIGARFTQA
jgi:MFS transporter, MCT family, solute carrier family 16 (monocarboxylic acid transporters), member 10